MEFASKGISWAEKIYHRCEDIYKDGIMAKETGKIVDAVGERLKRIYDDVTDDLINPFSFVDDSINEDDLSSSSSSSLTDLFALSTSSSLPPPPSAASSSSASSSLISSPLPVIPPPPSSSSASPSSLLVSPPPPPSPSSPSASTSPASSSPLQSSSPLSAPPLPLLSPASSSAFTPSLLVSPTPPPPSSSASTSSSSSSPSSPSVPSSSPSAFWAIDSHGQLQDKQKDENVMFDKNTELTQESFISSEVKVKVNKTKSTFDPNYFASMESSGENFILERENGEDGEFDEVGLEDFDERESPLDDMEEVDSYELSLISQRAMENNSYKTKIKDLFASKFCSASRKWGYRLRGASDAKLEEKYMRERLDTTAQGISAARGSSSYECDWELL